MAGALIKIGLGSDKPIDVKGVKVAPRDVLLTITPPATQTFAAYEPELLRNEKEFYGCSLAEVKGEEAGEKITRTVYRISRFREAYKKWGTAWAGVAVPAALTATMLAKREIKIRGVIPPEGLEPEPFLVKLAEKGWVFQERITREIRP
jgi:saccharopine dehydrogenase-like NADP-dependent oxidoreductase